MLRNNRIATVSWGGNNEHRVDPIGLHAGKIKHIVYIVKENRTYDQLFQFNDNPWYDLNTILGTVATVPVPNQTLLAELSNRRP